MGQKNSSTDRFEQVLGRGRRTLSSVREDYSALEGTDAVPDRLVEAIGDLERELDELDQTLQVTDEDVRLAEETARRVEVLGEVFDALRERQRLVVEADIARVGYQVSALEELGDRGDPDGELEDRLSELGRRYGMLRKLAGDGRHAQATTNDRVSPSALASTAREIETALEPHVPEAVRAEAALEAVDELLADIHEALGELGEENDDRTAYRSDLTDIKDRRSEAEEALEEGTAARAARLAAAVREDCLDLHSRTARARTEQQFARTLAGVVRASGLDVDCDVDRRVAAGDAETLLASVTDVLVAEVDLSTGERLRQLLREHDGSVVRTAEATDFDVPGILAHLEQLYEEGYVSDVGVEFDG